MATAWPISQSIGRGIRLRNNRRELSGALQKFLQLLPYPILIAARLKFGELNRPSRIKRVFLGTFQQGNAGQSIALLLFESHLEPSHIRRSLRAFIGVKKLQYLHTLKQRGRGRLARGMRNFVDERQHDEGDAVAIPRRLPPLSKLSSYNNATPK